MLQYRPRPLWLWPHPLSLSSLHWWQPLRRSLCECLRSAGGVVYVSSLLQASSPCPPIPPRHVCPLCEQGHEGHSLGNVPARAAPPSPVFGGVGASRGAAVLLWRAQPWEHGLGTPTAPGHCHPPWTHLIGCPPSTDIDWSLSHMYIHSPQALPHPLK